MKGDRNQMNRNWFKEIETAKKIRDRNIARINNGDTYKAGKVTGKEKPSSKTDKN